MASYIIKREIAITRQEGDTGSVEILVPKVVPLAGCELSFQVYDRTNKVVLRKDDDDWTREDADTHVKVSCELDRADTLNKPGTHWWELFVVGTDTHLTIGKGNFIVLPRKSKSV